MIDIDALEKLAKAATPGPWQGIDDHVCREIIGRESTVTVPVAKVNVFYDQNYIAAANPAAILALIAELRAAREVVKAASANFYVPDDDFRSLEALEDSLEEALSKYHRIIGTAGSDRREGEKA